MFAKQKRHLVLVNTITFLVLFSILGVVLFQYTKSEIYREVDKNLLSMAKVVQKSSKNNKLTFQKLEPNNGVLVWSEDGELLESTSHNNYYRDIADKIKYKTLDNIEESRYDSFYFRSMAIKIDTDNSTVIVQLIRNTNSQKEFLETLNSILVVGGVLIFVISVVVAFYLASKALVPIVKAWEKQQQFVSDASHELRTPLTIIQSKLELLLKSPEKKVKEVGESIAISLSETRRLSKLVNNLLTLAKSDSNAIELDKKVFCLSKKLDEICEPYIEIAEFAEKTFIKDLEQDVYINADEDRIAQLMIILLDNALKYTSEGDIIKLSLKKKNNKIFIEVKDNGLGISKENLPYIFDRFYRGDKVRGREGGHGLGLSIAEWIVKKHGGNIQVSSEEREETKAQIVFSKN
ncbi:sensor histidine kinase [Clostridium cibarium]|uniref:histidine kinase n=1 Tax=Clostridium cibarium TaxID=2762247 RepID=A0ABR8PXB6_9CLOT|nr:HAMP domain-containing sensor histidine kinase [Clostridium cibarium]MBD7912810.1 HAMP domain-containing histidine kinase [Clostridium cibarium]